MNPKILVLLALMCALPGTSPAADAIQNVEPLNLSGFSFAESGFRFRATTNITVTALGYFFKRSDNPSSYVVRLLNGNGAEVGSVTNSAPAATTNQLVYTAINPVLIPAGTTNTIQAYDALYAQANPGVKLWDGYVIDTRMAASGSFTVAPQIEYLYAVTNGLAYNGTNAPFNLLVGPNLLFPTSADVVPSALTLTLLNSSTAQLSWPVSDVLGVLQSAATISGVWTNVPQAVVTNGANKQVDVPVVPLGAYFRLKY